MTGLDSAKKDLKSDEDCSYRSRCCPAKGYGHSQTRPFCGSASTSTSTVCPSQYGKEGYELYVRKAYGPRTLPK